MKINYEFDPATSARLAAYVGRSERLMTEDGSHPRPATDEEVAAWLLKLAEQRVVNFERDEAQAQIADTPLGVVSTFEQPAK